jgi:CMP-N,N'-diacetyllegionaminic acid synthase
MTIGIDPALQTLAPCLAIIPARGGSKGLPGKNIRPLCGLPLIAHSIRCAERAPQLARTVVSTDSEEIAAIARAHGGDVPFLRPAELARDDTPTIPVLVHALLEIEQREGRSFNSVLLLEPTSPGRLPEDITAAFSVLAADPDADGVVACSRPSFNPFYVGVVETNGYLARAFDLGKYERRQDVPPFLRINGALYIWRTKFLRNCKGPWLDGRHRAIEIPEARAFSIDDLWEFQLAELILRQGLVKLPWLETSAS